MTYITCSSLMNNKVSWKVRCRTFACKSNLTQWSLKATAENHGQVLHGNHPDHHRNHSHKDDKGKAENTNAIQVSI